MLRVLDQSGWRRKPGLSNSRTRDQSWPDTWQDMARTPGALCSNQKMSQRLANISWTWQTTVVSSFNILEDEKVLSCRRGWSASRILRSASSAIARPRSNRLRLGEKSSPSLFLPNFHASDPHHHFAVNVIFFQDCACHVRAWQQLVGGLPIWRTHTVFFRGIGQPPIRQGIARYITELDDGKILTGNPYIWW